MGKFDGILICTDLDGTLLRNDKTVSKENHDAIEYFKSEGGSFTFITGRLPYYATKTCELVKPNVPFGCDNGGALYDHFKGEYVYTTVMSDEVSELVRAVEEGVPSIGIQVNTFYNAYFSKDNSAMEIFRQVTGVPNKVRSYTNVGEPIAKMIFGSTNEEDIFETERILRAHPMADKYDFIRSEHTLFEILPKGIGKGVAIKKLAEYLGIDMNKTVAIGDYNNDISMFYAAKAGIAVANACPEALAAADFVTVSNEEHAVARVIYDIENGMYI